MSREDSNRMRYSIALIAEFSKAYGMDKKQTYNYLKRFRGLDYIRQFYDVLHTLSFSEAVHALSVICTRNGGTHQHQSL